MNALLYCLLDERIVGIPTRLTSVTLLISAIAYTYKRKHELAGQKIELIWLISSFQACHGIIFKEYNGTLFSRHMIRPFAESVCFAYITAIVFSLIIVLLQLTLTRSVFVPRESCIAGILCSITAVLLNSYLIIYLIQ